MARSIPTSRLRQHRLQAGRGRGNGRRAGRDVRPHGFSLPANLQLKVGQFLTEFGWHNPQHPHSWAFADQPLAINRMFGPDGLRGQGPARVVVADTLYTEAMLTVQNSAGETAFSFRSPESEESMAASLPSAPP